MYLSIIITFSLAVISLPDSISSGSPERNSPGDWIKEEQIQVYPDKVILNVLNPTWAKFTDTNSMDPFIDENANAVEISPENPEQIKVGDVISYVTTEGIIIHRIIAIEKDHQGIFFIVKGDNTSISDPVKVRFDDIRGVVVAVIY